MLLRSMAAGCSSHLPRRCAVCSLVRLPASLERFVCSEGSSVPAFVSLCQSLVASGEEGVSVFLELLAALTDFEAWASMARDEAKRKYVKQIIAAYAQMAAQQQQSSK